MKFKYLGKSIKSSGIRKRYNAERTSMFEQKPKHGYATYAAEIRSGATKTMLKKLIPKLETTEMKIVRGLSGQTLMDRER